MTENNNDKITKAENTVNSKQKENKILKFIIAKKYYAGLIIIIFIIIVWALYKINILRNNFQNKKSEIINKYELRLDSLNTDRMQLTAKTFSWAIRSELIRENKEQINQFFNEFIKIPEIIKLQYINSENSKIEISTDKKDEGTTNLNFIKINSQIVISDSLKFTIITPITGLNKKLGVFVISISNLKKELS